MDNAPNPKHPFEMLTKPELIPHAIELGLIANKSGARAYSAEALREACIAAATGLGDAQAEVASQDERQPVIVDGSAANPPVVSEHIPGTIVIDSAVASEPQPAEEPERVVVRGKKGKKSKPKLTDDELKKHRAKRKAKAKAKRKAKRAMISAKGRK